MSDLQQLYAAMIRIRVFEERAAQLYRDGQLPGFIHLSIGQEASAVGVAGALGSQDRLTTSHRGHGHLLAKGVAAAELMAELFGRVTGVCRGFGGSMHAMSLPHGVLGANGIVGPGTALALGSALALDHLAPGAIAVAFFGDGAITTGSLHEALCLGALWRLPVLFVCEDNGYVEFSAYRDVSPIEDLPSWVRPYRWQVWDADGSDVTAVRAAAEEAIESARAHSPAFLRLRVSRFRGHYEGDPQRYRDDGEKLVDPLKRAAESLPAHVVQDAREKAETEIDAAVLFARDSDWPSERLLEAI